MNEGKRGKPFRFPQSFIVFMAYVHVLFLPYRQMEGFLRGLSRFIPEIDVADYSTLCKRLQKTEIPSIEKEDKDLVIALDSTGIKVSNRGEWMRDKWRIRRGWIKVHIAVDVKSRKLLALKITDERTGDSEEFVSLKKQEREEK